MAANAGADVVVLNNLVGPRIGAHYSQDELCVLALLFGEKFFRQLKTDIGVKSGSSLKRSLVRLEKERLLIKRRERGKDMHWRDFYELTGQGRAYAGQIQMREMTGLFLELDRLQKNKSFSPNSAKDHEQH